MKCSLKDGFINILLLIFIAPSKGADLPLLLQQSSVAENPINFKGFLPSKNVLQQFDSFPDDFNDKRKLHKIVKKQMASTDYRETIKSKRSILNFRGGEGFFKKFKEDGKVKMSTAHFASFEADKPETREKSSFRTDDNPEFEILKALTGKKNFSPDDLSILRKDVRTKKGCGKKKKKNKEKHGKDCDENRSYVRRFPDLNNKKCYYECHTQNDTCVRLRHCQCPDGQVFSPQFLKCINAHETCHKNQYISCPVRYVRSNINSDDPEPPNEWVNAPQGGDSQKIPSEFKPKKKPILKIYHLRVKRKAQDMLRKKKINEKRHILSKLGSPRTRQHRNLLDMSKGTSKKHAMPQRQHPRSFLIRINKKETKDNQESITENDDNETEEDDEENDEEDEDEELEDDDDENDEDESMEDEEDKKIQGETHKDTLKDFFKSAKAAITNKAKLDEPNYSSVSFNNKESSNPKSKKSNRLQSKSKTVLLDANIKVDSQLGKTLKAMLKKKIKDIPPEDDSLVDNEGFISDRGSQDQMDPELIRMYEHLIRNNPRIKRYFMAFCAERGI